MKFLKITIILLFVILTAVAIKIRPEMHQPMLIEDADFQLTQIKETNTTKAIPVTSAKSPVQTNTIVTQTQQPVKTNTIVTQQPLQTKTIKSEQPKTQKIQVNITAQKPDTSQQELLQRVIKNTEQNIQKTPEPAKTNTLQQPKPAEKTVVVQSNNKNPYMSEQEEIIAWNKWRSNIQNQIMRDSDIGYAPIGTVFSFTFIVDKFGNVSNIKVECSNPNLMNAARQKVKPAIANLQKKPILNFPRGTQRTSTVFTGTFSISTSERYSTPNDFSDYERVKY